MIPAWINGELVPVDKLAAHRQALRHPAVFVFVAGPQGILIHRRALAKYHTPGLWANACCTHPMWGEATADCARRRLAEELGIGGLALRHRGQVEYRADVGGGMVEHELVEVFAGRAAVALPMAPDRAEVMAVRWIALPDLLAEIAAASERFTPWLRIYLAHHATQILREGPEQG